jgi:hypothetical protein
LHRHYRSHETPADKAVIYTIAVIVCAIIVWIVIFAIVALLFGL